MRERQNFSTTSTGKTPPPRQRVRRALRYMTRFGLKGGVQAARVLRSSSNPVTVKLPGLHHPLWVRPGTSDALTFDEVFLTREYDLPIPGFVPRHVLDLGANVGYASVWFATRWAGARILAVEPERDNMVLLKRNTGAYCNVEALHAAVWSRPGAVEVANPEGDANAFQMREAGVDATQTVSAFTISQLIDRLGCERLDLLKMDVEGAEREILGAASTWLDRVNVLVVELHDRIVPGCGEAFLAALQGRRFALEIMGQNLVVDLRSESAAINAATTPAF